MTKKILLFAFIFLFFLAMKPQCAREEAEQNCRFVCLDAGYVSKGYEQTGFFTFTCRCTTAPKKPLSVSPLR